MHAGKRLPYAEIFQGKTIRLRNGALMQAIALTGLPFETVDSDELDHMLVIRDVLLRTVLDSNFIIYHHLIRRQVTARVEGEFSNPLARAVDDKWKSKLDSRRLFVNDQYLCVIRRPPRGKTGLPQKVLHWIKDEHVKVNSDSVREIDNVTQALVAGLAPYGARSLTNYDTANGTANELLEFISLLYNGEMKPVISPGPKTDIGCHIPYVRVSFGLDAIEHKGNGWRNFSGILGIKEYPAATRAGLFDVLSQLDAECVVTQSFAPAERQIARERIDLAIRRLRAVDDDTASERRDMLLAKDALVSGQAGFGDHHFSVLVRAGTLAELDIAIAKAAASLGETGAVIVREEVNLEPAFWAQFPGNEAYAVRKALVSTGNAAGLISLHGFPLGTSSANHWGSAVCLFETSGRTPYFFNFHANDLGHFTVIGPSGSGKTVALNFLAAQAQRFTPRTVIFDKDRGSEIFVRALGGHYARVRPGQRTGFNPFQLHDSPENRAFLVTWLSALIKPCTPEEEGQVQAAIDMAYQHRRELRKLRNIHELLSGKSRPHEGDLASRLNPWIHNGAHAWLFDNDSDAMDLDQSILGFDMTDVLDMPALRTPTMMYLFHRIEQRLDGEPTLIIIDEGWKVLDDTFFAGRLRDWLKTLRKRNAVVGFGTQSARDALESSISTAIVEQTATQIFMPNAKGRKDDYCSGFGLSGHELEIIRALPAGGRSFLIRHANHSVVVKLNLSGEHELLKIISGREKSVREMDELIEIHGPDPRGWLDQLTGGNWNLACESIS
nr:VirB4 family type IV secretion/conjugal transfer ATPase [Novosphingobium sp. ERN07]